MKGKIRIWPRTCCLAAVLLGLALPTAAAPPTRLDFLGAADLPLRHTFAGTTVGGISGITYYPVADLYFAVSDDPGQFGPVRFYSLKIDLSDGRLGNGDVTVTGMTRLLDTEERGFERYQVDAESIVLAPSGLLYVSSEGLADRGVDPFLRSYSLTGTPEARLTVPRRYRPRGDGAAGIRHNLGFEGLAVSGDGSYLYVVTENALAQDGPVADVNVHSPARLMKIDIARDRVVGEYLVWTDAISRSPRPADDLRTRGLVELLALEDDSLLALEREFVRGHGHRVALYQLTIDGATNFEGRSEILPAEVQPVVKELLFDFADLGIPLDNFEGMTFGPDLRDGRRTLIVVSDDNFNPEEQRTRLLAFALGTRPVSPSDIQGPGHRSPLAESFVLGVEGVVTAVEQSEGFRGFWLQAVRGDGDEATSDAVRVSLVPGPQLPRPGDGVRVSGKVREAGPEDQLSITEIAASGLRTISRGNTLPPPQVIGGGGRQAPTEQIDGDGLRSFRPDRDAIDFFESLEGMRVEVPDAVVIGPTSSFGLLAVLPDAGAGSLLRSRRGGLVLAEGDINPERILVDTRLLSSRPVLNVGDRLRGPLQGVVEYAFGDYRLLATSFPQPAPLGAAADSTALAPDARHLTVATYNVLNLSARDPQERFAAVARTVVEHLRSPDILALQEIQDDSGPDDDGTVSAEATLERLVTAIQAAGGPIYGIRQVDPADGADGGQPGGNIRVAYLFNPARILFVDRGAARSGDAVAVTVEADGPHFSLSPGRVAPRDPAFAGDPGQSFEGNRKPLAAEMVFQGHRLFLINCHLKSKRGDDRLFGPAQPPRAHTELQRRAQTLILRRLVDEILAADPSANVIVLGDLNEHEFRTPLQTLTSNQVSALPLTNLMEWVPVDDRYSYNYQGNSQVLDHVLISPNLVVNAAPEIDIAHVNADFAAQHAASDHDPVVVRLRLPEAP